MSDPRAESLPRDEEEEYGGLEGPEEEEFHIKDTTQGHCDP